MNGNEVRQKFLEFFEKHQHRIVRSSSLVPRDDPTLLFTNAGMVQFKRCFLGEESRGYLRAATSQKCVRAGGKHNDLENVGYTARHHTFFEMLGNFSFGDYFKEDAIEFAWDLLVNGYGLPTDKLWISIYLDDDEAFDLWRNNIGVSRERIIRLGEADNFWSMGDVGPCGPCSEIHVDRGAAHGCGKPECAVGCDCDRYLEIWNLVFMQFNRDENGTLTPLPRPSIDTGLGLERMASLLQNVDTNYDTDLIMPIIKKTEMLSEKRYGDFDQDDIAMKVIADHSRSAAFLIGDGVLPSNEGRGYVLRRIMRRAIRYGRNIGLIKPFLHQTADVVFEIMKSSYPELSDAKAFISKVIKNEEVRFSETLDFGLKLLGETLGDLKAKGEKVVPGDVIFKLYDTYGFPVDIVRDVVRDEDMVLDIEGFDSSMENQRSQSRSVSVFSEQGDAYKKMSSKGILPIFIGYDEIEAQSEVMLLVQDGKEVQAVEGKSLVEVVTAETPFYGKGGGQIGDTGIMTAENLELEISDTIKDPTGLIIHKGNLRSGRIKKGQKVILRVDARKRADTSRNHTATHILHSVLREVLGEHIKQAGSFVASDRLRFDFTHFSQVDIATREIIEAKVNERIIANTTTHIEEMDAESAFKSGATALFEEKYGDRVRVVTLSDFSRELCGGTHTRRTGDIGLFKIIDESSIASGVRRIEALTGTFAVKAMQQADRLVANVARLVKTGSDEVVVRVEKLIQDNKAADKMLVQLKAKMAESSADIGQAQIRTIDNVSVLAKKVAVDTPSALRALVDRFKDKLGSGIVVLGAPTKDKALLVVSVSKDLTDRYHAGNIIKAVAANIGGGGGGRADMAQAGGPQVENLDKALEAVYGLISSE